MELEHFAGAHCLETTTNSIPVATFMISKRLMQI